jgi:hypothetical protein
VAFAKQQAGLNAIVLTGGHNTFGKAFYGLSLGSSSGSLTVTKVIDGTSQYSGAGDLVDDLDYAVTIQTLNKLVFSFSAAGNLLLEVK